ncbi:hypothetical protein CRENBAI_018846 [Crenichthys baileyi]|uniref:Uncharacterized protein n=1 Tax=Crenichthys baileyi TaxID=28760 RepID=A0AAV9RIL6_9TELE
MYKTLKKGYLLQKHQVIGSMFMYCVVYVLSTQSHSFYINAAWHGGSQPVALLRCLRRIGCLTSSSHLISLVTLLINKISIFMKFICKRQEGGALKVPNKWPC